MVVVEHCSVQLASVRSSLYLGAIHLKTDEDSSVTRHGCSSPAIDPARACQTSMSPAMCVGHTYRAPNAISVNR